MPPHATSLRRAGAQPSWPYLEAMPARWRQAVHSIESASKHRPTFMYGSHMVSCEGEGNIAPLLPHASLRCYVHVGLGQGHTSILGILFLETNCFPRGAVHSIGSASKHRPTFMYGSHMVSCEGKGNVAPLPHDTSLRRVRAGAHVYPGHSIFRNQLFSSWSRSQHRIRLET